MSNIKKQENKRMQILEAALELFYEKGYGNTSISDIMKRTGISKGGIYWYFQSKDEIYVAMMEEWYEKSWILNLRSELANEKNAVDKLRKYGQLFFSTINIPLFAILPESYLGTLAENYHDRLYSLYKIDDEILHEIFTEAINDEEINKADVNALVWVYSSILEGMFSQLLFKHKNSNQLQDYYFIGIDFFINGIIK